LKTLLQLFLRRTPAERRCTFYAMHVSVQLFNLFHLGSPSQWSSAAVFLKDGEWVFSSATKCVVAFKKARKYFKSATCFHFKMISWMTAAVAGTPVTCQPQEMIETSESETQCMQTCLQRLASIHPRKIWSKSLKKKGLGNPDVEHSAQTISVFRFHSNSACTFPLHFMIESGVWQLIFRVQLLQGCTCKFISSFLIRKRDPAQCKLKL